MYQEGPDIFIHLNAAHPPMWGRATKFLPRPSQLLTPGSGSHPQGFVCPDSPPGPADTPCTVSWPGQRLPSHQPDLCSLICTEWQGLVSMLNQRVGSPCHPSNILPWLTFQMKPTFCTRLARLCMALPWAFLPTHLPFLPDQSHQTRLLLRTLTWHVNLLFIYVDPCAHIWQVWLFLLIETSVWTLLPYNILTWPTCPFFFFFDFFKTKVV